MKKKIRFIINPMSGTTDKEHLREWILGEIHDSMYDIDIVETEAPRHAIQLSEEASQLGYDVVVSVGGDGSVNEVASGLMGSSTALGIIPTGSGNGMARHLGIPMNFKEAVRVLNYFKKDRIDTLRVNDLFCIGTFGVGFDGHVAHLFSKAGKRGYSTYVKLVLSEFYKYKSQNHVFEIDGKHYEKECFLLTFANSSQFGNNAVIAPYANVQDGIIEISVIHRFPVISAPSLIYRMMNNSLHKSRFFEGFRGSTIILNNKQLLYGHIDGEPVEFNSDIRIEIVPLSLNVIVPSK